MEAGSIPSTKINFKTRKLSTVVLPLPGPATRKSDWLPTARIACAGPDPATLDSREREEASRGS
jgi:hypothetical protein